MKYLKGDSTNNNLTVRYDELNPSQI